MKIFVRSAAYLALCLWLCSVGAASTFLGFNPPVNYATGFGSTFVLAGDFNNDGKPDILSVDVFTFSMLFGNGDGTFQPAIIQNGPPFLPTAAVAVDLNEDGVLDVMVCAGDLLIFLGNGDGTFTAGPEYGFAATTWGLVAGDFNKDGHVDLAVFEGYVDTPVHVRVLLGKGTGALQQFAAYQQDEVICMVGGDLNGDGKTDLAITTHPDRPAGKTSVYLGNGDGAFTAQGEFRTTRNGSCVGDIADVNGDGIPDLVSLGVLALEVVEGNGDGTFQANAVRSDIKASPSQYPVVTADFNQDGFADVVVTEYGAKAQVLLGDATGHFLDFATYFTGSRPRGVAVADFNGDGFSDFAVAVTDESWVSVLMNEGIQ